MATAPTITAPDNGKVIKLGNYATVTWQSNTNRPQTAAELVVEFPGGGVVPQTFSISGAGSSYDIDTTGWTEGQYTAKVRAQYYNDATWTGYSPSRAFYVYAAPSVSVTLPTPTDHGTISALPLQVGFSFSDGNGTLSNAAFTVYDSSDMSVVYASETIPADGWTLSGGSYYVEVPTSELLLDNGTDYVVKVTAASTTGLAVSAQRIFRTAFLAPTAPYITAAGDYGDGGAYIHYGWEQAGTIPVTSVALYRLDYQQWGDRDWVMIDSHEGTSGSVDFYYMDPLPLLDSKTQYKAVAFAASGAYSAYTVQTVAESGGKCFFNWGADNKSGFGLDMDLAWTVANEPKRAFYEVIGRRDPVLRTTDRRTKTLTASASVWWDSLDNGYAEQLQEMPGRVWFREPKGYRYPVAVTVSLTYPKGSPVTAAQISMTVVSEV